MTPFAAVVLAHADPHTLHRLVSALDGVPVYLHVDARTAPAMFGAMTSRLPDRVTLVDRIPTRLASWSLVEAELAGLRAAVRDSDAQHIGVLSGADQPLVPTEELVSFLAGWAGESLLWNAPMPFHKWDAPRHPDGGMWRLERRFLTRGDQLIYLRGMPLRWPWKRSTPAGVELRASSQWKIYSRRHAERLLAVVDERPDLVDFWRTTLVPDETFVASVLGSPELVGSDAIAPCWVNPWFVNWPDRGSFHPEWIRTGDLDRLSAARWAEPVHPAEGLGDGAERPHRKLFARKFSSAVDADVLDLVEKELRR